MDQPSTTCSTCNRAVLQQDVDSAGNCVHCQTAPAPQPAPAPESDED